MLATIFTQSAPEPPVQPITQRPAVPSPVPPLVLDCRSNSVIQLSKRPSCQPQSHLSHSFQRPDGECPHLRNSGGGERVEMVPRICNSSLGKCSMFHSGIEATLKIALLTRRGASGGSRLTITLVIRPLFPFGSHCCKYANKSRSCCGVNSR